MSMFSDLLGKLQDKKYRDLFVEGQIKTGLPFQVRAMRDQRGWTQAKLGNRAGMPQAVISRLENPDSGYMSLKTLLRFASTFDVALIVRFAPFSELAAWVERQPYEVKGISPDALAVLSFDEDKKHWQASTQEESAIHMQRGNIAGSPQQSSGAQVRRGLGTASVALNVSLASPGQGAVISTSGTSLTQWQPLANSTNHEGFSLVS